VHLASKGCARFRISSRSAESSRAVAEQCAADWVPFTRFTEALQGCDILVTATGAPHEVVHYDDIARAMAARGGRELCVIDLADPPDVDPRVSSIDGVTLHTMRCIDDLASETKATRAAAARVARSMIEEAAGDPELLRALRTHPAVCAGGDRKRRRES